MCFHNCQSHSFDRKEYKDMKENKYYRICRKCGIAQVANKCASLTDLANETYHWEYKTDKTLCRTNNWIDRETWKLRYGN